MGQLRLHGLKQRFNSEASYVIIPCADLERVAGFIVDKLYEWSNDHDDVDLDAYRFHVGSSGIQAWAITAMDSRLSSICDALKDFDASVPCIGITGKTRLHSFIEFLGGDYPAPWNSASLHDVEHMILREEERWSARDVSFFDLKEVPRTYVPVSCPR